VVIDVVPLSELEAIWEATGVSEKRASDLLLDTIVHRAPARDPRWTGGEARIVKLLTQRGQHIGTVHEVVMPDGSTVHSHPKDYTQRDCSRVRAE
jgi:hypothetical protein